MHLAKQLLSIALLTLFITACGGGGGSESTESTESTESNNTSQSPNQNTQTIDTETTFTVTQVNSMAVKGPLANAIASLYGIDTNTNDFKGQLLAEGFTDSNAQLVMDIENRFLSESFFIIEYTLGKELNGATPVIPTLRTLITSDQLRNNTPVYATPLTTLAIDYAIAGLASSSAISVTDFASAVNDAALETKAAFGLGILDDDVNIFTSSPILSTNTAQAKSLAYRTTIEVFAALAEKVQDESATEGTTIEAEALVQVFAEDMLDGTLDGENDGEPITQLAALGTTRVQQILSTDPNTLTIPGTQMLVSELYEIIVDEAKQVARDNVTPTALSQPTAGTVSLSPEVPTSSNESAPQVDVEVVSSSNHEPANLTVTLSWSAPTTRLNGDPLTVAELAGYAIYYYLEGAEEDGEVVSISNPGTTSQSITLSASGTYNFAIATIDTDGLESDMSTPISFVVD